MVLTAVNPQIKPSTKVDPNSIKELIDLYGKQKHEILEAAQNQVQGLDSAIEQLKATYQQIEGNIETPSETSSTPTTNSSSKNGGKNNQTKAKNNNGAVATASVKEINDFVDIAPSTSSTLEASISDVICGNFVFPPSKFIEKTIMEAIQDYFPTRGTPPTAVEIFNKFYKVSHKDWTKQMADKVRRELQNVLDRGVEHGAWVCVKKKYSLPSK